MSSSISSTRASLSTTSLFVALAAASVALVWLFNDLVMSEEVFAALVMNSQNVRSVEVQHEAVRSASVWGYILAPLQTCVRIGFVALVIQMLCLLGGIEIPYGRLFRIATIAFGAIVFGSLLQILWITLDPTEAVTRASLGIVPDSLAAWLAPSTELPSFFYLIMSQASITALLWTLLVYWGLRETNRLGRLDGVIVAVATWVSLSLLKVGTTLFVRELVS